MTKAPNTSLPIQSPYLPIVNTQAQIMVKAVEQLGFSPALRTRIQVAEELPRGPSGWDAVDALR